MKRLLGRLVPRRIAAQTAAVVVVSVVLVQGAMSVHFHLLENRRDDRRHDFVHVGTVVRAILAAEPGEARGAVVDDMARAFPSLRLVLDGTAPARSESAAGRRPGGFGPPFGGLDPEIRVIELDRDGGVLGRDGPPGPFAEGGRPGARRVALGLPGGEWLRLDDAPPPPPPFFFGPLGTGVVFMVLSSVLLGVWAARGLVGPLRALAAAARDFDIAEEAKPLPRRGPEEVRVAAAAFDAMRRRIRSLVEDRTRMLAAMGHDLRTPLTRLRLRSEFVGDEALKTDIQRDLVAMGDMIDGALSYLSEGRHREAPALVDLSATIQTVCDGWSDLGREVAYEGPDHLLGRVRPVSFERALANLVDNALKYGTHCTVRARAEADGATVIEVEDDGPGIAAAEREAMLQPFVRGDAARNMDDHRGFGLGLAIVKAVVDAHRGRLEFRDAVPHGLVVRITLPAGGGQGS